MNVKAETIHEMAHIVDAAAQNVEPITMLTESYPELSLNAAYIVQRASMQLRKARGEHIVGMKMGLTSKAKMQQMGVHDPIYGHLTSGMQRSSGDSISMADHCHPRVEPELAFLLDDSLEGPCTAAQAMRAVGGVCAALEVIDSRYRDFKFTLTDVVADNASSTRFFLGDTVLSPYEIDVANVGMVMSFNGELKETGSSAAIFEHPARSLARLVNMLMLFEERLEAGMIVLAGGATKAVHVEAGDHVELEVQSLGRVELNVAP